MIVPEKLRHPAIPYVLPMAGFLALTALEGYLPQLDDGGEHSRIDRRREVRLAADPRRHEAIAMSASAVSSESCSAADRKVVRS